MQMKLIWKSLLFAAVLMFAVAPVQAQSFSEHGTGGTLDETWSYLEGGAFYQDDIIVNASSAAPDADGYILEFYDRDLSYYGIAGISSTPEVWLDLNLKGWVYTYATPQNGSNVQPGLMFRADPTSSARYGRVLLQFAHATDKVKIQTYDGGWDNHYFNIPDASATTGWHYLEIAVAGANHDTVTVALDGDVVVQDEVLPALAPGGTLEASGTVGLMVLHYLPSSAVPCYFDAVEVNDLSAVGDWRNY